METRTILAWPYQRTDCAYNHKLYDSLKAQHPEISVSDYRPGRLGRHRPDVFHMHWPETAVGHPNTVRALLRGLLVLADLAILKLRGTKVVWTKHDSQSHAQTHPRLERFFSSLYSRLTDGFIHLTERSMPMLTEVHDLVVPNVVVAHGIGPLGSVGAIERRDARCRLGIQDLPTIGIVGRLESYKNVVEAMVAFETSGDGQLLVAGAPTDPDYGGQIRLEADKSGIATILRRLTPEEFSDALSACDVVLLPYSNHLNSGVAIEALSRPSRIAVSRSPAMDELAASLGPDWVRLIEAPPSTETMQDLVVWAGAPLVPDGIGAPELTETWAQVAEETLAFFNSRL